MLAIYGNDMARHLSKCFEPVNFVATEAEKLFRIQSGRYVKKRLKWLKWQKMVKKGQMIIKFLLMICI